MTHTKLLLARDFIDAFETFPPQVNEDLAPLQISIYFCFVERETLIDSGALPYNVIITPKGGTPSQSRPFWNNVNNAQHPQYGVTYPIYRAEVWMDDEYWAKGTLSFEPPPYDTGWIVEPVTMVGDFGERDFYKNPVEHYQVDLTKSDLLACGQIFIYAKAQMI